MRMQAVFSAAPAGGDFMRAAALLFCGALAYSPQTPLRT